MGPVIWLIIAAVCALGELALMDFSLIMLGGAALVTAGAAAVGIPLWAEVAVFCVASAVSVLGVRPMLRRRLLASDSFPASGQSFSPRELEGKKAQVVEAITSSDASTGLVSVDGDLWSARAAHPGETYAEGDFVSILSIEGTTAVVWKET